MNELPVENIEPKRKSYFYYFKIVTIVFAVILAYVWFFVPPLKINGPIRLEKDEDGNLTLVGKDEEGKPISLQAGALKANNSKTTITSSSKSSPAYFFSRSLVVMNFSEHPLMERVGLDIVEILKKENSYDRVEYFPNGHLPETGKQAPDHYLSFKLESIEESGLLASNLKATIVATFGNMLVRSNSSTQDHLTPPIVRFNSKIELEHKSEMEGVESSAAKYKMQSESIAKEITKDIFKQIEEYEKDEDLISNQQIDKKFYPEYTPTPEFDFLKRFDPQLLTSTHGVMSHNETYWKIENISDSKDLVFNAYKQLEKAGWKSGNKIKESDWDDSDLKNANRLTRRLRMTKGSEVLKIFQARMNMQEENNGVYFVRFQNRMSNDDLKDIFEKLLAEKNPDYEFLVSMRRYANNAQRTKIIKTIEKNPPQTHDAWKALAEHYSSKKNKDATFDALRKLYHINFASTDSGRDDSTIKRIAKKLKLDVKEIKKLDLKVLQGLGFTELSLDSEAKEVRFNLETPGNFVLVHPDPEKEWKVVSIQITPKKVVDGTMTYNLKFIESLNGHGRSWSSMGGLRLEHLRTQSATFHGRRAKFEIEKLEDGTFRATGKFEPPKPKKKKSEAKVESKTPAEV